MSAVDFDHLGTTELCVVCGDQADGNHYGVLSCRGCNAFFRRAVTFNMVFTCRRDGTCPINKNARCACRACRFKKCKVMGMDWRAVQPRRDRNSNNAPVVGSPSGSSAGSSSHPGSHKSENHGSPGTSTIGSPDSAFSPFGYTNGHQTSFILDCLKSIPTTSSIAVELDHLSRLCLEFNDQKRRRRSMLCTTLEEILSEECDKVLKGPAYGEDFSTIYKVQCVLMFEWVERLDDFKAIKNPVDKTLLLREFALRYLLLDNLFHTVDLGFSDRIVLVNNTVIMPGHFPPVNPSDPMDVRKVLALLYGENCFKLIQDLLLPMVTLRFTEAEMMALRLVNFWNPGSIGLTAPTVSLVKKASEKVIGELFTWYKDNGVADAATRMGNVLLLLGHIPNHMKNLYEAVKLIPTFGVMYEWDSFMTDLLKI
ncbi:hypothetical protein QR680_018711 [Steinernema hermaphroditum]|uniref:Nuclear receptor domain-containing protein n=1 Tax=Steinernema hermaphroditum TaxID=289476 RepID=A0AA39LRI3_9BILA|nr:hypothetical protein QR680_018711 [Steinernema hermaphroditum]